MSLLSPELQLCRSESDKSDKKRGRCVLNAPGGRYRNERGEIREVDCERTAELQPVVSISIVANESSRGDLIDKVIKIRRCAAVVKGGRRFSFNGPGRRRRRQGPGRLRLRQGQRGAARRRKGDQGRRAADQAAEAHVLKGDTIPHRSSATYGAAGVILVPAGPGTGVKAGPGVRDVLDVCGRDQEHPDQGHGSTNPINLVKAPIEGLAAMRTREEVGRLRGVTL